MLCERVRATLAAQLQGIDPGRDHEGALGLGRCNPRGRSRIHAQGPNGVDIDATPIDEPGQIKPGLEHFGKTLSRWRR